MADLNYQQKNKEIKFGTIINNRQKKVLYNDKSSKKMKKMAVSAMELPPGVYFKSLNAEEEQEGRYHRFNAENNKGQS